MHVATFQRNFPPEVPVPDRLAELLIFQNRSREWYSGHFALEPWTFGDLTLFDGDDDAAEQFIVIGNGPDRSMYAFWLYPGRPAGTPPIVFISSEGPGSGLLAGNLDDFLALLAVGAEELGFSVAGGRLSEPLEPAPRLQEFRTWLRERFGIVQPSKPLALVAAARRRHPDFSAWMENWQTARMFD